MEWKFKQHEGGDLEKEPHEAEFFRSNTELTESVVREFIQNSLDAKPEKKKGTVNVSFRFGKIERDKVKQYFDSLIPHIKACGLPEHIYTNPSISMISFLTIEDFGTTGLDGKTGEDGSFPPKGNNFYDFWWREGGSGKSGQKAGRWGLGKTAFHIASLLRSFWGFTVRYDDNQELLLGKASIKPHDLNGSRYKYYGYFVSDGYNKPIRNGQFIRDFKQKFSVSRDKEPGLSIVIPFPDLDINASDVIKYVVINYFYAILKGYLEVKISEPGIGRQGRVWILNADRLRNIAKDIAKSSENDFWKGTDVDELLQFVQDMIHTQDTVELKIDNTESPEITEDSFGDKITKLKDSFNAGNLLAFKIPITIEEINKNPSLTHFKIYVKKYPHLKTSNEFYIRSGITILGIKNLGNRPVRGILIAEDETIARFLGDSENPAHTDWNPRTEGFADKYMNAKKNLLFVKNKSIKDIVSTLDEPPKEIQRDFLKEVFSIPIKPTKPKEKDNIPLPIPPIPPSRPPLLYTQKIDKGFKVSLNKKLKYSLPVKAEIKVAFDVRRGNPFKQYEPYDFDLGSKLIQISSSGCNVLKQGENKLIIEVTNDNIFNLQVTGFDPKRDLVVSVREVKHETQI